MIPNPSEVSEHCAGEGLSPLCHSSAQDSPERNRAPPPLSVRLRSNSPKRMKVFHTRDETDSKVLNFQSGSMATGLTPRMKNLEHSASVKRTKSAEQWYNDTNRNVSGSFPDGNLPPPRGQHYTKLSLDDPPFYLRKSLSDFDSACAVPSDQSSGSYRKRIRRVPQMQPVERTVEELRSVIDDLTVRNKKLRQKLKRYEKLHCTHLRKEILFEVRMHGLQSRWKRNLEQTLRSFASNMEDPSRPPSMHVPPQTSLPSDRLLSLNKPACSSTNSQHVDSAYASLSASGQTLHSQSARNEAKFVERPVESIESNRQNINSHPHDIQQGLFPKTSRFMSEQAKQKLIVRRLEQLFTGRGPSTIGNRSNLQHQPEVAHCAASAEIRAGEAGGHLADLEGVREARILPAGAELPTDLASDGELGAMGRDGNELDGPNCGDTYANSGETLGQRPTSPFDLDVYRAQIPGEAVQYVQHLDLASPRSWIYLNLLSNMAQLHAFNVTAEFVRKAVARFSSRFEISTNGQKLRWKGGNEGAQMGSESESNAGHGGESSIDKGDIGSGRRRRTEEGSWSKSETDAKSDVDVLSQVSNYNWSAGSGVASLRRPDFLGQFSRAENFQYKPLFFHGARSDDDDDDNLYDSDTVTSDGGQDYMTGGGSQSQNPRRKARSTFKGSASESGPIIFFNGANFCTDLSGDSTGCFNGDTLYSRFTEKPLGCKNSYPVDDIFPNGQKRSLILEYRPDSVTNGGDDFPVTGLHPTTEQSNITANGDEYARLAPIYMEASGLGGVQPQDNFSISVQVQHARNETISSRIPSPYPYLCLMRRVLQKLRAAIGPLTRDDKETCVEARIISSVTTMLPPSTLPEPSYHLTLSEDEESYDAYDDNSSGSEDEMRRKPSPISSVEEHDIDPDSHEFFLAQLDDSSQEASLTSSEGGSEGDDDDSSIDLLAHARVLDPDTIATQEREFDDNNGQILAELPAGSSAATAGGGSGFSSEGSTSLTIEDEVRPKAKRRKTAGGGTNDESM